MTGDVGSGTAAFWPSLIALALVPVFTWGATMAIDYPLPAEVVSVRCDLDHGQGQVVVQANWLALHRRTTIGGIPSESCLTLQEDAYALQNARSRRSFLFNPQGECVFDSHEGYCTTFLGDDAPFGGNRGGRPPTSGG